MRIFSLDHSTTDSYRDVELKIVQVYTVYIPVHYCVICV